MDILVIAGPTASGKSNIAIDIAKKLNGEIISADSMQVYKFMDIGTAKVINTNGIPHHLINIAYPNEAISVAYYQALANQVIKEIQKKGKLPILVGGSGFYINAVLYGINFNENSQNIPYRNSLYDAYQKNGIHYLYDMLKKVDEVYATQNKNNYARLIRGLEFYYQTRTKISVHNSIQKNNPIAYNAKVFIIDTDRKILYENINKRVDIMIEKGLVNEVQNLLNMGYTKDLSSLNSIGYKEIVNHINGNISLNEAIDDIKKNSRHFAKRQITWFKNKTNGMWVQNSDIISYL